LNPSELAAYAEDIRATVRQWVKLPASVGIAQTKTLAKAANKRAKKLASGVLVLQDEAEIDALLASMPAEELCGGSAPGARRCCAPSSAFTPPSTSSTPLSFGSSSAFPWWRNAPCWNCAVFLVSR